MALFSFLIKPFVYQKYVNREIKIIHIPNTHQNVNRELWWFVDESLSVCSRGERTTLPSITLQKPATERISSFKLDWFWESNLNVYLLQLILIERRWGYRWQYSIQSRVWRVTINSTLFCAYNYGYPLYIMQKKSHCEHMHSPHIQHSATSVWKEDVFFVHKTL